MHTSDQRTTTRSTIAITLFPLCNQPDRQAAPCRMDFGFGPVDRPPLLNHRVNPQPRPTSITHRSARSLLARS